MGGEIVEKWLHAQFAQFGRQFMCPEIETLKEKQQVLQFGRSYLFASIYFNWNKLFEALINTFILLRVTLELQTLAVLAQTLVILKILFSILHSFCARFAAKNSSVW